jgi:hypothetical protein
MSRRSAVPLIERALVTGFVVATMTGAQSYAQSASTHRPRATGDFAWLTGNWEGKLAGQADVSTQMTFQSPSGGMMTGLMRLLKGDKAVMIELISLVDGPAGVELRFRHFTGALETLEPVFKQSFVLMRSTSDTDTFKNVVPFDKTLMSTEARVAWWARRGPDEMVAHSDILDTDGQPGTVEVLYHRVTHVSP